MRTVLRHHECPRCGTALDNGPVLYRCARCRKSLYAADLDNEYHGRTRSAA